MSDLTEARLSELEALAGKATPRPWQSGVEGGLNNSLWPVIPETVKLNVKPYSEASKQVWDDAAYIVAAVNSLPELVKEVRRLRAIEEQCCDTCEHWDTALGAAAGNCMNSSELVFSRTPIATLATFCCRDWKPAP